MTRKTKVHIKDITRSKKHERFLYKCFAPIPFRKYKKRQYYLEKAIPKGFNKKLLTLNGKIVGLIEFAPAIVSGLPIKGDSFYVLNCIWVLRKAKGHDLGRALITDAIKSIKNAGGKGLATIGLENHPSPWLKKVHMEKLDFEVIDTIAIRHKIKSWKPFEVHLMWIPLEKDTRKPILDKIGLLQGVTFCLAHPLYHPESVKMKQIFKKI